MLLEQGDADKHHSPEKPAGNQNKKDDLEEGAHLELVLRLGNSESSPMISSSAPRITHRAWPHADNFMPSDPKMAHNIRSTTNDPPMRMPPSLAKPLVKVAPHPRCFEQLVLRSFPAGDTQLRVYKLLVTEPEQFR